MLIGSIVGEKAAIGQEKDFGILKKQQKCVKENAGLQFFTAKPAGYDTMAGQRQKREVDHHERYKKVGKGPCPSERT